MVDNTTNNDIRKPGSNGVVVPKPVLLALVLSVLLLVAVSLSQYLKHAPAESAVQRATQAVSRAQPADASAAAIVPVSSADNPVIRIRTDLGVLKIELYPEYAPKVVHDFLELVNDKYFDDGVLLESRQGVGFVIAKIKGDVRDFGTMGHTGYNGIRSERGSVAIAINDPGNAYLNNIFVGYQHQPRLQKNYRIFGQVLEGLEAIEKGSVARRGVIESVSAVE